MSGPGTLLSAYPTERVFRQGSPRKQLISSRIAASSSSTFLRALWSSMLATSPPTCYEA